MVSLWPLCGSLLLLSVLQPICSLEVLLISTIPSRSHYIFSSALVEGLLPRGHVVTEFTFQRPSVPHPNRTVFLAMEKVLAEVEDWDLDEVSSHSLRREIEWIYEIMMDSTVQAFTSEGFKQLKEHIKGRRYDVMVVDYTFAESFIAIRELLDEKPPVVSLSAYNLPMEILSSMGSPFLPALMPYGSTGLHGGQPMTLSERAHNVIRSLGYALYREWIYKPWIDASLSRLVGPVPPLAEMEKSIAIALTNSVPPIHGSIPVVPSIIQVGGMHVRPAKPLPAELKAWVDGAEHGFVFMSLGTNVRSNRIKPERLAAILSAFGKLKQRVLWKFEDDSLNDKLPPNVRVGRFFPQNDLFAHPKIRAFITHNGGLSTQEACYHGVPMLGIPFFYDQIDFGEKTVRMRLGRRLQYKDITADTLYEALLDVIENKEYRENMKRLSAVLRDQPETPVQRAVWWVEHVSRNGGAPFLRSPGLQLSWYQVCLLDLILPLVAALGLALWVLVRVTRCLCGRPAPSSKLKRN